MPSQSTRRRRHLALLGGTTTLGDCLVALRYLASPRGLIKGPAIRDYERSFARRIGVRYAYSFSAGRVALYGLLGAMGIEPGDEVLVPVPTHVVVANAIRFAGARPVFVDCELDSYNIDLEHAERQITRRTRVLLLQHTFGIPVDLDAARDLARRHGLDVIEDCVHALGASYKGKPVGSVGRAAFFSTEETKTISSTMGGVAVTDDAELAAKLEAFQAACAWPSRSLTARYLMKLVLYHLLTQPLIHGQMRAVYERIGGRHPLPRPTTQAEQAGKPAPIHGQRLTNAQAALAHRQLDRLDSNLRHRRHLADAIGAWLSARGFHTPRIPSGAAPAFVRYPIWVGDRAAALKATRRQLVLGTWFTSVLEESAPAGRADYVAGSCPRAELAAKHLVNLPTHGRVRLADVDEIAAQLVDHAGLRGAGEEPDGKSYQHSSVLVLRRAEEAASARAWLRANGWDIRARPGARMLYRLRTSYGLTVDLMKSWDVAHFARILVRELSPQSAVLDVGSAGSELPWVLHMAGMRNITGCDLDRSVLAMPFSRTIRYRLGDVMQLGFERESFDAVTAVSTIEHGIDVAQFLSYASRILRPNGLLCISTDYWPDKIDTTEKPLYNLPWSIFSEAEIRRVIRKAAEAGLVLDGRDEPWRPVERPVQFNGANYTYIALVFRKQPSRSAPRFMPSAAPAVQVGA